MFDFHALRHQFISMLAKAGVHPKTAQELARHSTITLTMDHYTHVGLYDLAAALSSIPALPTGEKKASRATGTDDSLAPHLLATCKSPDFDSQSLTTVDDTGGQVVTPGRQPNTIPPACKKERV